MGGRRRNIFVLLFVLGLVIVSGIVCLKKPTQLGLDLQGGIELTLQGRPTPQVKEVTSDAMDRSVDIIRSGCDKLGVSEIEVSRLGADQISVGIPGATNVGTATECATKPARLYFYNWQDNLIGPARDLSLAGTGSDQEEVLKEVRQQWIKAGRPPTEDFNRTWINQGAEPTMWDAVNLAAQQPRNDTCEDCTSGDKYYLFDEKTHDLISGPVTTKEDLYFNDQGRPIPHKGIVKKVPQGTIIVEELPTDNDGRTIDDPTQAGYFVLKDDAALSGSEIKDPQQSLDEFNQPNVTFEFNGEGRKAFQDITRTIAQEGQARAIGGVTSSDQASALSGNFAIILDGQVVSKPIINFFDNPDGIDGRQGAQISGGFTIDQAQSLAEYLQRGALPIDLKLTSQSQVSATLGQEALDQGVLALLIGLACVILFLITFYRFLGGVASLALLVYAVLFLALIKLIPITMTLPGIAGLVLTIGVAADSNIVIFERVKEEMRAGRSVQSAITLGYRRGISTIIDANVVTLLTAFILFVLATSGIKGFAFTLGVGTLVSLLTAVVFTQALLGSMSNTKLLRSGKGFSGIEGKERWHFDFMGKAPRFFAISGVILLIGAGALTTKGLNFGIDFESGTRIEVSLDKSASTEDVRGVLSPLGLGDADIQTISNNPALGDNAFQIESDTLDPSEVSKVDDALNQNFGVSADGFNSTSVGPTFGASVARSAALAIFFSLILIMGYVAIRFGAKYTVPVLIAIAHDFLIALGIYALLGFEVSSATVAAFLTILGYSQYDTIIVFDRIRENEPKMPRATYSQVVNKSMSEVMTRSLVTSFSTVIGVVALLIFGGEVLRSFAIAILVGVASGTYSSIFIASPVLALWKEHEPGFKRRRRQQIETQGYVPAFASDLEVARKDDGNGDSAAGATTDGGAGNQEDAGPESEGKLSPRERRRRERQAARSKTAEEDS
ncbi:MAG: protein translocase subunit SecD [Solirubrobacterales bacterium]|nr:protein translocase subunit SecD [Solirubrobacterales bacterium]MCB8915326.1 protein translocase subunit SecD [Thermoleophilales bacterium]